MKANGVAQDGDHPGDPLQVRQPLPGRRAETVSAERSRASAAWIRWIPAAPDHLSRLTEQGFRGVRLSPAGNASGDWFRGPLMPPLWKRCHELKVPMTVLAPITRMPEVGALLEKLPDLTVVIDHMADCPVDQPAELEKLIALKRYPKVFVKISHTWSLSKQPYPWLDAQEHVKRLHAGFRAAAADVGHRLADRGETTRRYDAGADAWCATT